MDSELIDVRKQIYESATSAQLRIISEYTQHDEHEMVSEAFTYYKMNGNLPDSTGDLTKLNSIFKRILSGGMRGAG